MFYVSMIDTFMSGWGMAKGKQNILIFECDSLEEAKIVSDNANNRTDQRCIEIHKEYPHFEGKVYVQHKDMTLYPSWYKPDFFRKSRAS